MSPRVVNKEERRRAILQAAFTVFSRHGFFNATVQDVMREAGMGKGTFYEYFDSKDDLAAAIWDFFMEPMDAELQKVQEMGLSIVEMLVASVMAIFEEGERWLEFTPLFLELAVASKRDESRLLHEKLDSWLQKLIGMYLPEMKKAQADGLVAADADPAALIRLVLSYIDGLLFHQYLFYQNDRRNLNRLKKEAERMIRLAIQGC